MILEKMVNNLSIIMQTADENIIRFAFSTPNSNVDRSFGIDLSLNKAQGAMDASFTSPWKRADFKGTHLICER